MEKLSKETFSFMKETRINLKNQGASLRNLEVQVCQIAQKLEKATNVLPNDTIPKPKNECKAICLRSGKVVEQEEKENLTANDKQRKEATENIHQEKHMQPTLQQTIQAIKAPPKESIPVPKYKPKISYPQRLQEKNKEKQYSKFLEIFKILHINIPFIKDLEQMPLYSKFMKDLLSKKRFLKGGQTVMMSKEYNAIIQRNLPTKKKDPGNFQIPCTIGNTTFERVLCDLGASINLMPLSVMKRLQIQELKPTKIALQLANKSMKLEHGIVENDLIKVEKYFLPVNFVILDIEKDEHASIILKRHFLAIGNPLLMLKRVN
ncbi:uncharacterized protein LOC107607296 [Arachis ipaensis]|uniref:uncharacterized protein LOC107607296 n=1 Tax=Arachis ipaensis TaxID=130454 RepID=UPI0007AF9EF5|nr:uncharacterized protein LOC107607296 [Arachis ipaensis]XP_025664831.1 uncharacterized protein LOC112763351 [Arachis hypogaea]